MAAAVFPEKRPEPICGAIWSRPPSDGGDLVCRELQGRQHGYLHRQPPTWYFGPAGVIGWSSGGWWLSGIDGVLIDDYCSWWDQAAEVLAGVV